MSEQVNVVYNDDCFNVFPKIADKSVDAIICDLPFGVTGNKWDCVLPLDKLWEQYERVIKDNGAIVLFGTQPFTTDLIMSNRKMFRYELIWDKAKGSNFQNARKMPMKSHENILVFYKKLPTYNPQMWMSTPYKTGAGKRKGEIEGLQGGSAANYRTETVSNGERYPLSIVQFKRDGNRVHPTRKAS